MRTLHLISVLVLMVGCGDNLNRSSAQSIIEASPAFDGYIETTLDHPVMKDITRNEEAMSNCGTDGYLASHKERLQKLMVAQRYGLVELEEKIEVGRNCQIVWVYPRLTAAGQSELIRDDGSSFRLRAVRTRVGEISGIKLAPGKTNAIVDFVTIADERKASYVDLLPVSTNTSRGYSAILVLYDDGWRVERIDSAN